MVRGRYTKGLALLVVVFWATSGDGAPTLNVRHRLAEGRDSVALSSANAARWPDISEITGPTESYLAVVGPEFHKPTVRYSGGTAQGKPIKSLPPVPSTFVLALLGFLFVTAVKDRRLWLAGLASVLCAGQGGFALLPQLASHLDPRGRYLSGSFHAPGLVMVRLAAVPGDTESSVSLDSLAVCQGSCGGAGTQRSAGIHASKSCGRWGGDNALRKHKVIQAAIWVGFCCLDYGSVIRSQEARQFLFNLCNGVISRLARGPPR